MRLVCALCGRQEDEGAATLSWTTSREAGRLLRYCETCSRDHVRSLEAKLDSEFW